MVSGGLLSCRPGWGPACPVMLREKASQRLWDMQTAPVLQLQSLFVGELVRPKQGCRRMGQKQEAEAKVCDNAGSVARGPARSRKAVWGARGAGGSRPEMEGGDPQSR